MISFQPKYTDNKRLKEEHNIERRYTSIHQTKGTCIKEYREASTYAMKSSKIYKLEAVIEGGGKYSMKIFHETSDQKGMHQRISRSMFKKETTDLQ